MGWGTYVPVGARPGVVGPPALIRGTHAEAAVNQRGADQREAQHFWAFESGLQKASPHRHAIGLPERPFEHGVSSDPWAPSNSFNSNSISCSAPTGTPSAATWPRPGGGGGGGMASGDIRRSETLPRDPFGAGGRGGAVPLVPHGGVTGTAGGRGACASGFRFSAGQPNRQFSAPPPEDASGHGLRRSINSVRAGAYESMEAAFAADLARGGQSSPRHSISVMRNASESSLVASSFSGLGLLGRDPNAGTGMISSSPHRSASQIAFGPPRQRAALLRAEAAAQAAQAHLAAVPVLVQLPCARPPCPEAAAALSA